MCDLNAPKTPHVVSTRTLATHPAPATCDDEDTRTAWMRTRNADLELRVFGAALDGLASYLPWADMIAVGAVLIERTAADAKADADPSTRVPALQHTCVFVVSMWDQQLMAPSLQHAGLQALLDVCVSSWAGRAAEVVRVAPILDKRGALCGLPSKYKFAAVVRSAMTPDQLASVLHKRVALDAHGAWHVAHDRADALHAALEQFADGPTAGSSSNSGRVSHEERHARLLGLPRRALVFEIARDQSLAAAGAESVSELRSSL